MLWKIHCVDSFILCCFGSKFRYFFFVTTFDVENFSFNFDSLWFFFSVCLYICCCYFHLLSKMKFIMTAPHFLLFWFFSLFFFFFFCAPTDFPFLILMAVCRLFLQFVFYYSFIYLFSYFFSTFLWTEFVTIVYLHLHLYELDLSFVCSFSRLFIFHCELLKFESHFTRNQLFFCCIHFYFILHFFFWFRFDSRLLVL